MGIQILVGDALEQLKTLPDGSVNCCVTSPPYYGLRDYGVAGQIGLEETPEAYVAKLVDVFREVRRVLRDDGTLWLNLGDSYSGYKGENYCAKPQLSNLQKKSAVPRSHTIGTPQTTGLGGKQLLGIPWRVAFALQADGWILRQDIIWHKPNPMPESVKDRCTKAHEYLFLLAKNQRYWFDSGAIKENTDKTYTRKASALRIVDSGVLPVSAGIHDGFKRDITTVGRNRRSVWSICPRPYKGAHFAVFPPALIEPCIKAGCPVDGTVLDPFGGSGTTGQVAKALGRNAILIELNPNYIPLIQERVGGSV